MIDLSVFRRPLPYQMYLTGHNIDVMRQLPEEFAHVVATSPPYYGLRAYEGEQRTIFGGDSGCPHEWGEVLPSSKSCGGNAGVPEEWQRPSRASAEDVKDLGSGQFCTKCGAWFGAFGTEPTPELYVEHTIMVLREIRRILRSDGVCFWNVGDSYAGSGKGLNADGLDHGLSGDKQKTNKGSIGTFLNKEFEGFKDMDLIGIPFLVATAAREDGWWLRSDIIWGKDNPMPESMLGWRWIQHQIKVKQTKKWVDCPGCDRCTPNNGLVLSKRNWRPTKAHEYILMLTKSNEYYCDPEGTKEPAVTTEWPGIGPGHAKARNRGEKYKPMKVHDVRNIRSVWMLATEQKKKTGHYAVFNPEVPRRCILIATPSKGVCAQCGAPWVPIIKVVKVERPDGATLEAFAHDKGIAPGKGQARNRWGGGTIPKQDTKCVGWKASCKCGILETVPAIVVDPFAGSGVTLQEAKRSGRSAIGIDINPGYERHYRIRLTKRNASAKDRELGEFEEE